MCGARGNRRVVDKSLKRVRGWWEGYLFGCVRWGTGGQGVLEWKIVSLIQLFFSISLNAIDLENGIKRAE